MESDLEKVPGLEDASQAQSGVDFVAPEEKPSEKNPQNDIKNRLEGFNGFALIKERKEYEFRAAIKTGDTFEKLAAIIDKYATDNNLPELRIEASKVRKEEFFEPTTDFGIADQYHILVDNKLNNREV